MKLGKVAVGIFSLLVASCSISFSETVSEDYSKIIEEIKQGYNYYWANIKDGKGNCTVREIFFESENPDKPKQEIVKHFDWKFLGAKMRYDSETYFEKNGQPTPIWPNRKIYFDGKRTIEGSGKNFVLREVTAPDIRFTNEWDPRLVMTGTRRIGKSWQPYPSWEERNWKIIGKEKINGSECYIIEEVMEGPIQTTFRRWIDPNRNYCVVKMETWQRITKESVLPEKFEWMRSFLKDIFLISHTEIELRKYGGGFWGPVKYESVSYGVNPEKKSSYISRKRTIIYDKSCAYNVGLKEKDLEITFPPDATIYDAAKYPKGWVKPKVNIEFRLTKNAPAKGFTEITIYESNYKIYIKNKSELSNADIKGVRVKMEPYGPEIEISFTDEGTKKFADLTQKHIGEHLAILVNGKVFSAPVIRGRISLGKAVISGGFTEEQIKQIIGEPETDDKRMSAKEYLK